MFAVEFSPKKSFEPCCTFEESPLDAIKYAALLSFTPDWSAVDQHALAPCVEVFFLIDRSGSMGDSKDGAKKRIVQAKEAMSIFLSSLPEGSKFQIIGFGSRYSLLFNNGSQPLNEKTLKQANEHVARLQADMGGTALLEPLEVALEEVASSEFPRIIFVLTDGNVENTEEVLKLVRTQAKTTRCFAIGLGADADEKLVNGLAKAGRGLADFVSDDATGNLSLQTVVVRQLARALEVRWEVMFFSCLNCFSADASQAVHQLDRLQACQNFSRRSSGGFEWRPVAGLCSRRQIGNCGSKADCGCRDWSGSRLVCLFADGCFATHGGHDDFKAGGVEGDFEPA